MKSASQRLLIAFTSQKAGWRAFVGIGPAEFCISLKLAIDATHTNICSFESSFI